MDLAAGMAFVEFLLLVGSLVVGDGLLVISWIYREHAIRDTFSLSGILVALAGLVGFGLIAFGVVGLLSLFRA